MSRVHDVGDLVGFGPLSPQPKEEPTFHKPWEGRTFGMMLAMTAFEPVDKLRSCGLVSFRSLGFRIGGAHQWPIRLME